MNQKYHMLLISSEFVSSNFFNNYDMMQTCDQGKKCTQISQMSI